MLVGGEIQSIYPTDGDWTRLQGEYWARALALPPRPRPRVLFVGLGGATQVHLLRRKRRPRLITIVERDAIVIRVAQEWFGLREVGGVEFLCADAAWAIRQLTAARRRFDFIMDDISYAAPVENAIRTAVALAPLLAPAGRLVLNQHAQRAARAIATALSPLFLKIWLRRVRRETENILIFAEARQSHAPSPAFSRR
jgi:spermidine synthase